MTWVNPFATAAIPASQSAPIVPSGGAAGNILVLDGTGEHAADSGVSFGTDFDQIPNSAQVSGMISLEMINAPTLPAVACATTANIALLSGLFAVDTYALKLGDFVLVKNQTVQSQNGVYMVTAGAWQRCYFNGAAWAPLNGGQATFGDLGIDGGIVQVNAGTINGSISYRCAVSDTSASFAVTTVSIVFSKTTLMPVADVCNRHVSLNNGNDTNNNGSVPFPFQTIGKSFSGMSYPGIIKIATSGGAYSEAVVIPATAVNVGFESTQSAKRGGMVRWTAPWSIAYPASGTTYHTYRGITWATSAVNPFSTSGGGGTQSIWIENCAFVGSMTDITPTPAGFMGTLTLRNIDATSAPAASVVVRANGGTYNIFDQVSPLVMSLGAGATGYGATINIAASCNAGCVWVPLTYNGTVNRFQPAPGRINGVLTTQAQLDALLANTAANTTGFYLINGFAPTQNAALAGGIIGHYATGSTTANWWERSWSDAPGSVDVAGTIYAKSANTSWLPISPAASGTALAAGSGNWTVPAGVYRLKATVQAAGGGGAGYIGSAGGGGAGEERIGWIPVTPGQQIAYSVGAGGAGGGNLANGASGGDTVFGGITAKGGGGGLASTSTGGVGGSGGSGGDFSIPGRAGDDGYSFASSNVSGRGADSRWGQGGQAFALSSNWSRNGNDASGYGAGGGGCVGFGSPQGGQVYGGKGSGGLIVLEW